MTYHLLLFYPGENIFFPTNHTSGDPDDLRRLAASDLFRGARTRIVDADGAVVDEPPVRSRVIDPTDPVPIIWAIRTGG